MTTYITGFPRVGENRELKKALEAYWKGEIAKPELENIAKKLRERHWLYQKNAGINHISVNDFSFYDQVLDTAFLFGAIPQRFQDVSAEDRYFVMARGDATHTALEMTKWFNTNYHYLVLELNVNNTYSLNPTKILQEYAEAKALGITPKINVIGPITFLSLAKRDDNGDPLDFLDAILPQYEALVRTLSSLDSKVTIQFEEPIFSKNPTPKQLECLGRVYTKLSQAAETVDIFVASYFDYSNEATEILVKTPIYGLVLDFVHGKENVKTLEAIAKSGKKLVAGVVNGRNIWISDIQKQVEFLESIAKIVPKQQLLVGSSCSLQHVPYSTRFETSINAEIKSWLAFACEKLDEVRIISTLFFSGEQSLSSTDSALYDANKKACSTRKTSTSVHNAAVKARLSTLSEKDQNRDTPYEQRIVKQRQILQYSDLATTTIGSFPQTAEVRQNRSRFIKNEITQEEYEKNIETFTADCIKIQEEIGLEVLVHGEFERNDMVEYFGQQLDGFVFTQNGWVQSYGSRCVKPPVIYGDVSRPTPMTVRWSVFAQSQTKKIMKGMLTGPVTILNWSFVRDDQEKQLTSYQVALALADEVKDLQTAGIKIIQIDEAALKEGYPLRKEKCDEYEQTAVKSFLISTAPAKAETQIHTHMCYSQFNDILDAIKAMDADVITIETARSGNRLLEVFKSQGYSHEIGPGVYDIHSPRVPSVQEFVDQIQLRLEVLPSSQLWVNPDCGLKTRAWPEVKESLKNMVIAVKQVRENLK